MAVCKEEMRFRLRLSLRIDVKGKICGKGEYFFETEHSYERQNPDFDFGIFLFCKSYACDASYYRIFGKIWAQVRL